MNLLTNKTIKKSLFVFVGVTALLTVPLNRDLSFGYGNSGGGGGGGSAPVCGAQKPGSAPTLLSAVSSGQNAITLTWSKANNPVTYYLITFGTKPGEQLYGNPNVGGNDTTSYTVSHLSSNQTYYFKVRAGNDCMPGAFSNEVAAKPFGAVFTNVPAGFQAGVLGAKTKNTSPSVTATQQPTEEQTPTNPEPTNNDANTQTDNGGLFQVIINFFKHLFGGK